MIAPANFTKPPAAAPTTSLSPEEIRKLTRLHRAIKVFPPLGWLIIALLVCHQLARDFGEFLETRRQHRRKAK